MHESGHILRDKDGPIPLIEKDTDIIQIAYNHDSIVYGQDRVREVSGVLGFTLMEVPRKIITILQDLPSSYFHFASTSENGIPVTTPLETIQKARAMALEALEDQRQAFLK